MRKPRFKEYTDLFKIIWLGCSMPNPVISQNHKFQSRPNYTARCCLKNQAKEGRKRKRKGGREKERERDRDRECLVTGSQDQVFCLPQNF
jgi:hypothetical protein